MKKMVFLTVLCSMCIILVSGQSLVELSKQEKERREKLKGKSSIVITNAELAKVRKKPAIVNAVEIGQEGEAPESAEPAAPAESGSERPYEGHGRGSEDLVFNNPSFATAVLSDTILVENPEYALYSPDGNYALISMSGSLDLELHVTNKPGNDLAVYAMLEGNRELASGEGQEGLSTEATGFQWVEGFWYGVLVEDEKGDWVAIGQGTGANSPESFDLGSVPFTGKIRIMFRPHSNAVLPARMDRMSPSEFKFGIDAVEAFH
jgi:hypothetical protein